MKRKIVSVIEKPDSGQRLDSWLGNRFTYHSRNKWQGLIRDGEVTVNDISTKPSKTIYAGDVVELKTNELKEPDANTNIQIIYEDDYIIVINKPADLPCHPSGAYFHKTLWYLVTTHLKSKVHIVHRLDRETSGVVIMAKTPAIAKEIAYLFANKKVKKTYIAAVHGSFPDNLHAFGYLEKDKESQLMKKRRFIRVEEKDYPSLTDKETAETYFEIICEKNGLSLLKVFPKTGRFHQIRATLYSMGFPMVGDKTYGLDETLFLRFITDGLTESDYKTMILDRQALHAKSIEFTLASTGKKYKLETEIPTEITDLFK